MPTPSLCEQEKWAAKHLQQAILEEESLLLHKSQVKWLTKGDNNNRFFFNQVKANLNHNKILAISNEHRDTIFGHSNVARIAVNHFSLFQGTSSPRDDPDLSTINSATLSPDRRNRLLEPVTLTLVLQTLKQIEKNKAPGLDGFIVQFFLDAWDILWGPFL